MVRFVTRASVADSRKWLRNGWADYFTPQLYWPIAQTAQSYPTLLSWWVEQNVKRRNIWVGNYTSKAGAGDASGWRAQEVLDQIRLTRAQSGASGNVHFSAIAFLQKEGTYEKRYSCRLRQVIAKAFEQPIPACPKADR